MVDDSIDSHLMLGATLSWINAFSITVVAGGDEEGLWSTRMDFQAV
jgi:hypothetical protein